MTTLAETLQAVLDPLAAGGAWFMENTQTPPVYPYIVWMNVVSSTNVSLEGASDLQNTRVQIDIFHTSSVSGAAQAIGQLETAVRAALAASSLVNVPLTSYDMSVPQVRAYRRVLEYSIWFKG
jgi:hypothetical protein